MQDTVIVPFNDLEAVNAAFERHGDTIAAVIVEPVAGNMGVVPPNPGFLEGLRTVTTDHGSLLVFDEVMTGWRVHPRGAQGLFGVLPDLTCLGKVMGGGLPAAAYGGRREFMERVAPAGEVYQAGTLSGNPIAMAAGLVTLDVLSNAAWATAAAWAGQAADAIEDAAVRAGVPVVVQRVGTMLTPFFTDRPVGNFQEVVATDRSAFNRFFHTLLDGGVYLPPSPFEAAFTSITHGASELALFQEALDRWVGQR